MLVSVLLQLFEARPVWSRNAVKANISIHPDKLKVLLPYLAYYMVSEGASPGSSRSFTTSEVLK